MQAVVERQRLIVRASASQGPKLVSPVVASRRNAVLGFAGACAGLLLPFTASAAQTTLKDDMPVTRTDRPDNNVYMPGLKYQKFDKPTAGGLVYVGRGTGSKGT